MEDRNTDSLWKAKNYAFLLLKYRARSEKELYQRLKKKKFEAEIINQALIFLKEKKFIDDELFAKTWIESRIKKPLGIRRLRVELKLKGIDKEIIDRRIEEIKKSYCEEAIVIKIAAERFNRLRDIEPQKARQRVFAYLARRGFSPEVIMDVINQLK